MIKRNANGYVLVDKQGAEILSAPTRGDLIKLRREQIRRDHHATLKRDR
jgi:hypothetical protein